MQLKPCPFCNNPVESEYADWNEIDDTGDDGSCFIECQKCCIKMTDYDKDELEERWNTRYAIVQDKPFAAFVV
jgi:hypothetical protein